MSFSAKVTARNIFRYKSRMLMTIIGVAGCAGLLVMGLIRCKALAAFSILIFKKMT